MDRWFSPTLAIDKLLSWRCASVAEVCLYIRTHVCIFLHTLWYMVFDSEALGAWCVISISNNSTCTQQR